MLCELFLSAMVIGEIRRGVESLPRRDVDSAARLEVLLGGIERDYEAPIFPVTAAIADRWGRWPARRAAGGGY